MSNSVRSLFCKSDAKSLRVIVTILTLLYVASTPVAAAGDVTAGSNKSKVCAGCHGINGVSSNDLWPNLAGQKRGYLVQQITAFRDGERVNVMMKPMVENLTDQDIEDIAVFYAQLD